MKRILHPVLLAALVMIFSGCQGFLEDYNYQPVGSSSSSSY